ncbi:hypothetical protein XENOCAPTIV_026101, partial [Xenoophorus captivus]
GSNSRALKIAGLTTLACLLVASQVFTAYMVFDQKQQIHTLQKSSERIGRQMTRTSQGRKRLLSICPITSGGLCEVRQGEGSIAKEGSVAPARMAIPMNSLPLQMDFTEDDSKSSKTPLISFESWMRYWLIFQMAQQKPAGPTPQPGYCNFLALSS